MQCHDWRQQSWAASTRRGSFCDVQRHRVLLSDDSFLVAADDEEDSDVLDPAQLATAYADAHAMQQPQQLQSQLPHHLQQHLPEQLHLHLRRQDQLQLLQNVQRQSDKQQSDQMLASVDQQHQHQQQCDVESVQSAVGQTAHAVDQTPGWLQVEQSDEEEEELICMNDPRFASLSERKQKLMALEEVLLNSGIEG